MNTNYTNTTITATNADKSLGPAEKIGMGVGISLSIILLLGCCYFACVYSRRSKETEKIHRRPSQVERRPSRRGSQLEIIAPTTPKANSKV
jgi:hypothetical protein